MVTTFLKAVIVNKVIGPFLLLFFLFHQSPLWAQSNNDILNQRYDYSCSNLTISEILIELSALTETAIAFDGGFFKNNKKSFELNQATFRSILESVLDQTQISFKYEQGSIVLFQRIKKFIISGYVEDKKTGERLVAATVHDQQSERGVITNDYGFFSLSLPEGKILLNISYLGYQPQRIPLDLKNNQFVKVALPPSLTFETVEVVDKKLIEQNGVKINERSNTINRKIISGTPTLAGEADLLNYLQTQTGVTTGTDGIGGLHVRGGGVDQNLILLDGVPIFNPSHGLGLFSIFNSATIKSATFIRSGFSARYGGHLSSVLDIKSKEGNVKAFHSALEISSIASKAEIEVPFKSEKGGLMIAARRSHLDPLIKTRSQTLRNFEDIDYNQMGEVNFNFYDLNTKMNYKLGKRDRLYLSFYNGGDQFSDQYQWNFYDDGIDFPLEENNTTFQYLNWGNTIGSLRWNHLYGDRLFSNTTFTISNFQYQSFNSDDYRTEWPDIINNTNLTSSFYTRILDYRLKFDFDFYLNDQHKFIWGAALLRRNFQPASIIDDVTFRDSIPSIDVIDNYYDNYEFSEQFPVFEIDFYLEDEFKLNQRTKITAGIHQAIYYGYDATYFSFQPRLNFFWQFNPRWNFSWSASRMTQFLHLLTASNAGLPNDLWVPATDRIGGQNAWESSLSFGGQLSEHWQVNSEVYYKYMNNLLAYNTAQSLPGLTIKDPLLWEDEVAVGTGQAYGIETELQYRNTYCTLNVNYTFSRSLRKFSTINNGIEFPFRFDRPHNFHINYLLNLKNRWQFQTHWQYSSGQPITLLESDFFIAPFSTLPPAETTIRSSINGYRMIPYHRLDMNVHYNFSKGKSKHKISLGAYNVYNRLNPLFSYLVSADLLLPEEESLTEEPGLGIIPTIGYSWIFN